MTSTKTILARILFLLYLAAIVFLCVMRVDRIPDIQKMILGIPADKIAHFLMFFPFPIMSFLAYDHKTGSFASAAIFAAATLVLGLGVAYLTEFIQGYLPYRSKDMSDFNADAIALAVSCLCVFLVDVLNLKKRN